MKSTLTLTPELAQAAGLVEGQPFKDICISGTCTSLSDNGATCEVEEAETDDDEDKDEGGDNDEAEAAPAKPARGGNQKGKTPVDNLLASEQGE